MKNRLDMEFNNYKRMKSINTGLHLYRWGWKLSFLYDHINILLILLIK